MKPLTRFKYYLWYFSRLKVPMIGYLRSRLILLDDQKIVIKIPLTRRSKNHLNSMYFGALAVGADIAGGLLAFYLADQKKIPISLVFKSFEAAFHRRPESDVYFICEDGLLVQKMLMRAKDTEERVNEKLAIHAYLHYPSLADEKPVASFLLELSVRVSR